MLLLGTIDALQITRDVNNSLIPMLDESGLQCKDAHMRPSLMRKILKEIGYAQSQKNGVEYFYKVHTHSLYSLSHQLLSDSLNAGITI